jgi:hypothetical protein
MMRCDGGAHHQTATRSPTARVARGDDVELYIGGRTGDKWNPDEVHGSGSNVLSIITGIRTHSSQ